MKTKYDISTKEKEISYVVFIDELLGKLGFKKNINGTKLLRELIIYLYIKDPFTIDIKKEITNLINQRGINISYDNYIKRIQYSIGYADISKMNKNFKQVFKTDFDYYYLSAKTLIILILSILEKTKFNS